MISGVLIGVRRRWMFLAFCVLGLLVMVIGAAVLLYVYAFASMVDPRLHGRVYWQEVLRGMFLSGAVVPALFGLTLVFGGALASIWTATVALGWITEPILQRRTLVAFLVGLLVMLAVAIGILLLS